MSRPGRALYRVRLGSGEVRWARGSAEAGPLALLPGGFRLDEALALPGRQAADALATPAVGAIEGPVTLLAPVESQEVWAAGVTYLRSRDARLAESAGETAYDRVYRSERPELFFKAPGWRVRGPGAPIGIRRDSTWDVPEPELALVLAGDLSIVGYVLADDVSSRAIEGENLLYLPQAKTYDGSCALGPCLVPAAAIEPPFELRLVVRRDGRPIFAGETATSRMARSFGDLAAWLGRAITLPVGAILLTGTGIVPDPPFTLRPGDEVEVAGRGLGSLRNVVEEVGTGPAA